MEIKTKYALEDTLIPIFKGCEVYTEPCTLCESTGFISYKDREFTCPDCNGLRDFYRTKHYQWYVAKQDTFKVDKILLKGEVFYGSFEQTTRAFWRESEVFLTLQEAQKECDERNLNNCPEILGG